MVTARGRQSDPGVQFSADEQLRLLIDGATDYAIFMLDPSGIVVTWNSGAHRIKGYTADEIVGRHFSCFYTDEDRRDHLPSRMLETAMREGRCAAEGWRVRKDGSKFWADVVIDAIRDGQATLLGFAKVTRDCTRRVEIQAALEKAQSALFQFQKLQAVGQLAGGVAHEFNNMLTVIIGQLDGLAPRLAGPDQTAVAAALHGAQRAATLTNRLLSFGRRQMLEPRAIEVGQLIAHITDMLHRTLGKGITIKVVTSAGVWPIVADPGELEAALVNLGLNARAAMPDGGTITAEMANRHFDSRYKEIGPGDYVMISMSDTGVGIPKENLPHVIEPFFTTRPVGEGSGLGLSQVYGFARQSGGDMAIDSELGVGTTVRLFLPRYFSANTRTESRPALTPPRSPGGEVVLVVEDDPLVRDFLVECLHDLGYTAIEAGDAMGALPLIEERRDIDLLLTDIGLPGMTGLDLAREATTRHPKLKIVYATGYSGDALTAMGPVPREAEMLRKPFTRQDLAIFVRSALDRGATA